MRRGYAGIWIALTIAALMLVAWKALEPHLPESLARLTDENDSTFWPEGEGGPYHWKCRAADSELLVVGDSRVQFAIEPGPLNGAGLGPTSILWGGGAQLLEILEVVRPLEPCRLVVAVSPFGFWRERSASTQELLALDPPNVEGEDGERVLLEWSERVRAILLEHGVAEDEADVFVGLWFSRQQQERARKELTSETIDRRLGDAFRLERETHLRTLISKTWRDSWFEVPQPEKLNDEYRYGLRPETHARRLQHLTRVVRLLEELRTGGWDIVVVRTPISPELLAIEEEALSTELVRTSFEDAGFPWLDYIRDEAQTIDGSHLGLTSAQLFSGRLAQDLDRLWSEQQ